MDGMPWFEPLEALQKYTVCRLAEGKDARVANKDESNLQTMKTALGFDQIKICSKENTSNP